MGRPGVDDVQIAFGHGVGSIVVCVVAFSVADIDYFDEIMGMGLKVRKIGMIIFLPYL